MSKLTYLKKVLDSWPETRRVLAQKPVVWVGRSRRDLMQLSEELQHVFGYAIDLAQRGGHHPDAKQMKGTLRDVYEVTANDADGTYRTMYTAKLAGVVYILHVFQKKSNSGRSTPKTHIALVEQRYKAARIHWQSTRQEHGKKTL